ncbi:MAG: ABC transporter ATP-binding protein/permease [Clostridiales bacterium]|jgi:ABC-type multidrug transport system fused ATPase/permease subunit|nr:ABC transporter ATP-binding protein/permease [Clostridiales bacterium]
MSVYSKLLRYVSEIKGELAVKVLLSLLISAAYIAQAIVMANVVTRVFGGADVRGILPLLTLALALITARGFLCRGLDIYGKVMAARIKSKLRSLIYDKIVTLGPAYMSTKRSGKVSALVLDGIELLEPFFVNFIPQAVTVIVSCAALGIFLVTVDVWPGLVVIVSMLACLGAPLLTAPLVRQTSGSYWKQYSALTAQYIDAVQGMQTLKAMNAADTKGAELETNAAAFYKQSIRSTGISLINSSVMLILTSIVSGVTVVIASFRADAGLLPVTAISAFLFLAVECARPLSELNRYWHSSFLGLSTAQEFFEFMDALPMVSDNENAKAVLLDDLPPSIAFRHVHFSYPEGAEAICGLSFEVKPGSTVAIAGHSGAGKSTVLNLILRFYDASSGAVEIGGVRAGDFALPYLQSKIAAVFQDNYLFSGTIAENIRLAKPTATIDEVTEAAISANAHGFISALPDGYNTAVGERGAGLSGGERQRIAIARAILKDAPILLLDEATSSVDAESEALIKLALDELRKNRTAIIVAHRLSTIQNADLILVMEAGRMAEQGTHSELMEAGGIYSALINAQTEGPL